MKKKQSPSIKVLKEKTFLKMIENSIGANLWKNNYGEKNGKIIDLTQNGYLSCAFFVSSILKIFDLVSGIHLTVEGLEKDLIKNHWQEISNFKKIEKGAVIIWEGTTEYNPFTKKEEFHSHSGFYLGNKKAVSMNSLNGFPVIHHYTYNETKKIKKIYCRPIK